MNVRQRKQAAQSIVPILEKIICNEIFRRRTRTNVTTIDAQRPKVHFMFERCTENDHNGYSTLSLAHQNSIWFTWNTQSNSIWWVDGLSVLMRNLRAHQVQWADYTHFAGCCGCCRWCCSLSVPSWRSVFHPTTDCPLLAICRFSSSHDHHWSPFRRSFSMREKQRTGYARIKWKKKKKCGCISNNSQWMFMANAICYCLLVTIRIL